MSLIERTATELLALQARGEATAEAITDAFLGAIRGREPQVKAFNHVDEDAARQQARAVDAKRKKGEKLGALAGVPVAVKDVLCTRGVPTTCSSKILKNFVPPYDAHVVGRLKAAALLRLAKAPAIALGGMSPQRFKRVERLGFQGWAGIDAWIRT